MLHRALSASSSGSSAAYRIPADSETRYSQHRIRRSGQTTMQESVNEYKIHLYELSIRLIPQMDFLDSISPQLAQSVGPKT